MAGKLELSDQQVNITMIRMISALAGKVDNIQKQMGNVGRDGKSKE